MKRLIPSIINTIIIALFLLCGCHAPETTRDMKANEIGSILSGEPFDVVDNKQFVLSGDNDNFALYVKPWNGEFYIHDKKNETDYFSNPPERDADPVKGLGKSNLNSQLWITYVGDDNTQQMSNTSAGSVMIGGTVTTKLADGFRVDYDFPDIGIKIPVLVTIDESGLHINIPVQNIEEYKQYRLYNIHVYPYFSAGGSTDEGYMFVPDGSGAVINYNNHKTSSSEYRQKIYGSDKAFNLKTDQEIQQQVMLPVFGVKKGNGGFVAVIDEGDEYGYIDAFVSGQKSSYNSVYAEFQFRQSYTYSLDQINDLIAYDKAPLSLRNIAIHYSFLAKDANDYSHMAGKIRERLIRVEGAQEKETESALFINAVGATRERTSFLGIPIWRNRSLTSYAQLETMVNEIEGEVTGPLLVNYQNATADMVSGKISQRISRTAMLGTNKEYIHLYTSETDRSSVSFEVAFQQFFGSGNGIFKYSDAVRNLSGAISQQYIYQLSTLYPDKTIRPGFLLNARKISNVVDDFLKNETKIEVRSIGLGRFASELYSNFGNDRLGREVCKENVVDSLRKIHAKYETVVSMANYYAIQYVSECFDVPATASGFKIVDYDVPFYQMVIGGLIRYSVSPVNLQADPDTSFLKAIESGSQLNYSLIYDSRIDLADTMSNELVSARYSQLKSSIIENYTKICLIYEKTGQSRIVSHRYLQTGVTETTYENMTRVIVNYTNHPVTIAGLTIESMQYAVLSA